MGISQLPIFRVIKLIFYIVIISLIVYYYGRIMETSAGKFIYKASDWISWPVRKVGEKVYDVVKDNST